MERPRLRDGAPEVGLLFVVVGVPLLFLPMSTFPYADPKLALLAIGVFLVGFSTAPFARSVAWACAAWMLAVVLATVANPDVYTSVVGTEHQGAGLILFGASALLVSYGSTMRSELSERVRRWFIATGVAMSAVYVAAQFFPKVRGLALWFGSTVGQPVHLAPLLSACVAAAATSKFRTRTHVILSAVLSAAIFVTGVRAGPITLLIVLAVVAARARPLNRAFVVVAAVSIGMLLTLTLGEGRIWSFSIRASSGVARLGDTSPGGSNAQRLAGWTATRRAWGERPVAGWGPSATWGAYMATATADEMRNGGRRLGDPHNLVLHSLVTSGAVGAGALLLVLVTCLGRARRASRDRTWALAAASSLGFGLFFQPATIANTALFFLFLGIAGSREAVVFQPRDHRVGGILRLATAVALLLASLRLVASIFGGYGVIYGSTPALRWSLRFEPIRYVATVHLAQQRLWAATHGEPQAMRETLALLRANVDRHPWHPDGRLALANAEYTAGNTVAALVVTREQIARFPNDYGALDGAARLAFELKLTDEARSYAERAQAINPGRYSRQITGFLDDR